MKFQFTSSGIYDKLKWVAQIGLPALAGLYFALSSIWGLPATEQVIGTISVVDAALGGLLGLSSKNYVPPTDGKILLNTTDHPDANKFTVLFNKDLDKAEAGDIYKLAVGIHPLSKEQIPAPPSPHQI